MIPIFRAKKLSDRAWVQSGSLIQRNPNDEQRREVYMPADGDSCQAMTDKDGNVRRIKDACFYKVDPDTLSMWSGVRDNNGMVIWEGDIISVLNTFCGESAKKEYYVVRWNDDAAALVYTDNYGIMYTGLNGWSHYCIVKVEGNVWDNPELLKKIESKTPEEFQEEMERIAQKLKEEKDIHES